MTQVTVKRTGRPPLRFAIIHGANMVVVPDDGLTVAELRLSYRDVLNVGQVACAYVDGNPVEDDCVPAPLAWIEFMRDWGWKGSGEPKFVTKKAARQAGYLPAAEWWTKWALPKRDAIPLLVKGEEFLGPDQVEDVISATDAKRKKLQLKPGTESVGVKSWRASWGSRAKCNVYRRSDFTDAMPHRVRPPEQIDLLRAIFVVNKSAKRFRDAASAQYNHRQHGLAKTAKRTKLRLYDLKDRGIAAGYKAGRLEFVGKAHGMALYRGEGYCFHSTLIPVGVEMPAGGEQEFLFVESAPRSKNESRLKDAEFTLEALGDDYDGFQRLPPPSRDRHFEPEDDGKWEDEYVDEDDESDDEWEDENEDV
jgi:hypothetical protein